jgi:hypothetical protein
MHYNLHSYYGARTACSNLAMKERQHFEDTGVDGEISKKDL